MLPSRSFRRSSPSRTRGRRRAACVVALLACPAGFARAQVAPGGPASAPGTSNPDVAIEQALDEKTDLDIREKNILAAVDELTKQTGVRVLIDENTLDCLPYGEQTKLAAKITGATLREGLTALLGPIGLVFEVRGGAVHVSACAPLRRIVKRATWDELDTLKRLSTTTFSEDLFKDVPIQFRDAGSDEKISRETLMRLAKAVGAGTAAEVLEHACDQLGWTWYPSGRKIVVLNRASQIKRQLDRRITARFFRAPLTDILMDLGREADVLVKLEPGVIASLPPQTAQSFSLTVENTSIRQALEVIAGTTGVGFFIENEGIRITANPYGTETGGEVSSSALAQALQNNMVIGMVTIKGAGGGPDVSFVLRENDLPPDLRAARKRKVEEAIQTMRKALEAEKAAASK